MSMYQMYAVYKIRTEEVRFGVNSYFRLLVLDLFENNQIPFL